MASRRPSSTNSPPVTIVNVGYRSTNYWVVSAGTNRVLVDLGYPNTLGTMRAGLTRMGVPLEEIRFALATHYHMDHAGSAQDLKTAGVPLLVLDVQVSAVPMLNEFMRAHPPFTPITLHDCRVIPCAESRAVLARLGIAGEIVHTPGHTDDSVSLLLDNGAVFTGDLTHPGQIEERDADVAAASWITLARGGARRVHPGHGPVWQLTYGFGTLNGER